MLRTQKDRHVCQSADERTQFDKSFSVVKPYEVTAGEEINTQGCKQLHGDDIAQLALFKHFLHDRYCAQGFKGSYFNTITSAQGGMYYYHQPFPEADTSLEQLGHFNLNHKAHLLVDFALGSKQSECIMPLGS